MKVLNLKEKLTQENPFYGKSALLSLSTQIHKLESDVVNQSQLNQLLSNAWTSCKTEEDKALFWILVFSAGDIANRDHNLFRKLKVKVEGGGNSARNVFYFASVWALTHSKETTTQWYSFMDLIPEYTNWENLFYNGIRTDRKKGTVIEQRKLPIDVKKVAKYLAKIISNPKTPDVTHVILAKFIDKPRTADRQKKVVINTKNKKKMETVTKRDFSIGEVVNMKRGLQPKTLEVMDFKSQLAIELSKELNWETVQYPKNIRFIGLEKYKATWNRMSEAYLFSSKEILNLDEPQFIKWLDGLPSGARFNVQRRLLNKEGKKFVTKGKWITEKGIDLATWYLNWLSSKETAQAVLRQITPEDKKNMTVKEVKQLEKAAKVNTGATTFIDILVDIFKGGNSSDINTRAQSILDKINIQVPVLVIADVSGSMSGSSARVTHNGISFTPMQLAQLATTIFLLKNPNEELSSMFIRFDSNTEIVMDGSVGIDKTNRFMTGKEIKVDHLIDKTKDFLTNYQSITKQIFARGSTNFNTVAQELRRWVESDKNFRNEKIEIINSYPVWLVISDGDMNNMGNAGASMRQFQMEMKQYFGWNGIVVVWDVKQQEVGNSKFENIENVMYYGGFNTSILHQIFCNLHDMDIIDVYTPLVSMFRSQRYAPVRDRVLNGLTKSLSNDKVKVD